MVGVAFVIAAGALYHPPYVVVSPGDSFDIAGDISITGVPVTPVDGAYLLASVRLSQPSALRLAIAAVRPDHEVLPLDQVLPDDVDVEDYSRQQQAVYKESQLLAAVAAARANGFDVTLTSDGARVVDVVRGSPASEALRAGDVIVAIEGQPVTDASQVGTIVRSRPAGREVRLTVERDGRRFDATVKTRQLPSLSGGVGVGVAVESRALEGRPAVHHHLPRPWGHRRPVGGTRLRPRHLRHPVDHRLRPGP